MSFSKPLFPTSAPRGPTGPIGYTIQNAENIDISMYPVFVGNTGTNQQLNINNGLNYNPSTMLLTVPKLFVKSRTEPNYISSWRFVAIDANYTFEHNQNITLPYVPRVTILFSQASSPVLGTNNVFVMATSPMSGLYNDSSNYQYGIGSVCFTTADILTVSTARKGLFYDPGGANVGPIVDGYIQVLLYM